MKTKVEIISIVIILMLSMISTNLFLTSVKAQDPQPLYIELDEEWSSNAYYEKEGVEYFAESIGVKAYLMSKPPGKWEYCFRVEGTCAINKSLDHWYTSGMAIIKSNNLKHEGNPYYTQAYNYTAMDTDSVDDGEIIPVIDLARTALISDPIIATFVQLSISAGQIAENMKDTSADGWTIPAFPGEEDLHKEGFGVAWYDLTVDANKEFTVTFDLSTSIFANVEGGYIYNINSLDGDDEHVHGNGRISITLTSPPPADLVAKKVYISSEPKNENKEIDNSNAINFEGEEVYLNFKYKNTDVEPAPSHDVSLKLNEIENTDRVTGLQGGQTKTISFPWVLEQKSFSLEGEVDVNDEVGFNYNQDNDVKEREYLFDWTEPEVQITKPEKNGFYFNGRKLFEFPDSLPWDALLIFGNLDAKVSAVDNVGMAEVWFRLSNDNNVYDYTDYKSPWKWSNCFRNGKWDLMACACDLSGLCMDDYLYDILCIYLIESKSILSPKDNNDGKSFEWNFQTKITNSNDILNTINLMNEDILTEIRYTYIFDFGDGESISFENVTDTSKNVNHEYEEEKIYNTLINLIATIKIDLNVDGEFQSDEIFIKHYLKNYQLNVGHIEQIDVNANGPYLASIGETIQFNATVEGGTPPYNWIWDFGDGNTMQDIQNPVYSFEKQGVYDVLVQVEDANGYKQKDVTKAIISGVELSVAPNPSIPGQEITFKANLGNINFTNEPYYIFNILDQNIGTVNDNITHIYEEPGIYIESVTVYDGENGEIVAYDTVTVYINSFEIDAGGPYAGFDGEPVFFEGSMISDAQLFMVEWDFGDGNTSSS